MSSNLRRFLVVGLGSMGKRRIRNLQALGKKEIFGFDPRADRRDEARSKYGVTVFDSFEKATEADPDALIISTPPDRHAEYAVKACEIRRHAFVEASVSDAGEVENLRRLSAEQGVIVVPSCTMHFFPGPSAVRAALASGRADQPDRRAAAAARRHGHSAGPGDGVAARAPVRARGCGACGAASRRRRGAG